VRLGIIGAGRLGRALGARFAEAGHQVTFGGGLSAAEAASEIEAQAGSNREAAAFAEIVVFAVLFAAIRDALAQAGPLEGKVLWSCVNALKPDLTGLAVGFETSAAEEIAKLAPDARVVSAIPPFAEAISSGDLRYEASVVPTVFVCGDDDDAKAAVRELVSEIGVEPVDAGPLSAARLIEPAMMLLVSLAYAGVPRDVGLRLLERGSKGDAA
jgi:predicted dinucleotide-binding enzyme